jgi:hypothetical protein
LRGLWPVRAPRFDRGLWYRRFLHSDAQPF